MKAAKIKWAEATGPAENARKQLPRLASEYFASVRKLLAKDLKPAELHRMRLLSKRFRYTLELFRPCYAAGLDERISELKDIQTLLGDCNDAVVSMPIVDKALQGRPAERARIRKHLEDVAEQKAAEFRRAWAGRFDAAGREDWWTGYLSRNARPPIKGK